jgi:ribonuclease HII
LKLKPRPPKKPRKKLRSLKSKQKSKLDTTKAKSLQKKPRKIAQMAIFSYNRRMILGIDEVGRGPWAGPLVVVAVVLDDPIEFLTDSKKLTKKKREALDVIIREKAAGYGLGWVWPEEIDEIGLSAALRLATVRAVEQVVAPYHEIIIDGTINFLAETTKGKYVTTLAKADLLVPGVSAASVIAKVARDAYMAEQHDKYPEYGFAGHVGYGTAAHRKAIDEFGVTPLHRLSFAPLKKYQASPTTKQIGDASEAVAAEWLARQGHDVIERNWKTRWCEIDIISRLENTLYFVEVKHRQSKRSGDGVEAITTTKLRQMQRAAELYMASKKLTDTARLAVVATTDTPPVVTQYLEIE